MSDITNLLGEDFIPEKHLPKKFESSEPPRYVALREVQSHGYKPPPVFPIDKIFRFSDGTDKAGKRSGWAIYFEYTIGDTLIGLCIYGSFKQGTRYVWSSKHESTMNDRERYEYQERIQYAKKAAEQEKEKANKKAAEECKAKYERLPECGATQYTRDKFIQPYKAKASGDTLVVPMYHKDEICSVQYIEPDGAKKFHPGGRVKGAYLKLPGIGDRIIICEGYSTGCTIHEATNETVYIAFNANNLYEVCQHVKDNEYGYFIIAADDDYANTPNVGRVNAEKCANTFMFDLRFPQFPEGKERGTDFNDLAQYHTPEEINQMLAKPKGRFQKLEPKEDQIENAKGVPPGVISDIYNYYMATSGNHQPGFALQTALAIVSNMASRYFITDQDNMTPMYFLNVGRSATGKEHSKKIIERIYYECNMQNRVAGDGFTSGAAVVSLLMQEPCSITVIDEFGRYLEAAASNKSGMQKEANTTLMEVIGRPDGVLKAKNYSKMTLNKDQKKAMDNNYVVCPSLTLLGLTTPNTFYDQIKLSSVLDGFMNRFVVFVSDAEFSIRKKTAMFDVPESIKDWFKIMEETINSANFVQLATERPEMFKISFTQEAEVMQKNFEQEMVDLRKELEPIRLDALPGRANEFAMRMALMCALSRAPEGDQIIGQDMRWAIDYIRASTHRLLEEFKDNVSENYIEANKKEIISAIRGFKEEGIRWSDMQMRTPFSKFTAKELKENILSLLDADLIIAEQRAAKGVGRPSQWYVATEYYEPIQD